MLSCIALHTVYSDAAQCVTVVAQLPNVVFVRVLDFSCAITLDSNRMKMRQVVEAPAKEGKGRKGVVYGENCIHGAHGRLYLP